jgi:exodeoxyribonuclease VII small subunit
MVQLFNEAAQEGPEFPAEVHTPPGAEDVSPASPAANTVPRFEDAYQRLEALVAEMERGDLPLEELLSRFEEGVGLVRSCRSFLKQAQIRVEQYVEQRDGHWVLKDLE